MDNTPSEALPQVTAFPVEFSGLVQESDTSADAPVH